MRRVDLDGAGAGVRRRSSLISRQLDSKNHGRSSLDGNDFVRVSRALDDESESSLKAVRNSSQQLDERNLGVLVVEVLAQLGNNFSIGLRFEDESLLEELVLEFLVVGDDTIVNSDEFVVSVRSVRMAVDIGGNSVSSPSSVSNTDVVDEDIISEVKRVGVVLEGVDVSLLSVNSRLVSSSFVNRISS